MKWNDQALTPALSRPTGEGEHYGGPLQSGYYLPHATPPIPSPIGWERARVRVSAHSFTNQDS